MVTATSDEDLMIRYREGDLHAFEELYARHRVGLYRFIAWRSPRADWVDEIVQDSWANLHHARERYQSNATFRTYLYQIARNRLLDLLRQQQHLLAADLGTGTVQIKDASGRIVQVLDDVENNQRSSESLETRKDFNNDGCADLVVTTSVAAIGNESIMVFLYNPNTRRFEVSEALSSIGRQDPDPRDKNCFNSHRKGGAMDFYTARHCWSKGKLVLKSEHSVSPVYNDGGEFECYYHVKTDYRGGKKRERTNCKKNWP